ncbi:MAG: hypothetical protein ACI4E5_03195 [Suilimivivens sp.]
MNNKKIKIYACIMTVCTLVLSFSMVATATTTSRRANLKSYGTIQMEKQDGTVKGVIAAADMEYLADEIDNLENTYKSKTLEGLNGINTYFKADGSVTHNAAESAITTSTANLLTFEQLNNAIKSSQASANAPVASEIVSGKSVWANGNNITGTMPNNGATGKANLTAGTSYTIPAGYTTGGTVTTATLASQTQGTATAANLSSGVTAWVNGTKITGTGEDNNSYYALGKGDSTYSLLTSERTINNDGYIIGTLGRFYNDQNRLVFQAYPYIIVNGSSVTGSQYDITYYDSNYAPDQCMHNIFTMFCIPVKEGDVVSPAAYDTNKNWLYCVN